MMNEHIEELLKQSTYDVLGVKQVDQKKFAELIIRECIQAVDNAGGYNEEFHMNAIKEHFGVV
jgi:hypothetical protein